MLVQSGVSTKVSAIRHLPAAKRRDCLQAVAWPMVIPGDFNSDTDRAHAEFCGVFPARDADCLIPEKTRWVRVVPPRLTVLMATSPAAQYPALSR
jgi:hypothetical protein